MMIPPVFMVKEAMIESGLPKQVTKDRSLVIHRLSVATSRFDECHLHHSTCSQTRDYYTL